jgi:phytoene desaturase
MSRNTHIIIVGAGPGGLAAGMLLSSRGFDVEIFEKTSQPGGRTSEIEANGFKFDVGPTFFMMKFILEEIFRQSGKDSADYLEFLRLSPMYRLIFSDTSLDVFDEKDKMIDEINRVFPAKGNDLERFYQKESQRFKKIFPILQDNNQNIFDALRLRFLKALPALSIGKSLYDILGDYFIDEQARLSFTFQAKYLGMSPWQCPGVFGIVPYVEHEMGVYHIKGGLSMASRQMAKANEELGTRIYYDSPVKKIITNGSKATGILLKNGEKVSADSVILNADFGYAMTSLFEEGILKKYAKPKLDKKKISCSIFMLYLGIKKQYALEHNTIVFAKDYKKNIDDIFSGNLSGNDISFYVRDTSRTDPGLAPAGKSALYVLAPVPNNRYGIDWKEYGPKLRKHMLHGLRQRLGLIDIEENIEEEIMINPDDWEKNYHVYNGAVFNLAHNLDQMLWFRPHNQFEEIENCFLVGGGTHPGSGLPTIYESGRITSKLICKKFGVDF